MIQAPFAKSYTNMSAQAKTASPRTFSDWLGLFCFIGCFLATVGLSCLGISNILKKGIAPEAIDALLSMLKLLAFNCGLFLASQVALHTCSELVLGIIAVVQAGSLLMSGLFLEVGCSYDCNLHEDTGLLIFFVLASPLAFAIRLLAMVLMAMIGSPMPFLRRAISNGMTLFPLISYALAALFIATAALGTFGLLAGPASILDKLAASVVACGTILTLAVVARLLRVLHASKIVHSKGLLGSLQSSNLVAFVISHHLGNTFLCYARSCSLLMTAATIYILADGWSSAVTVTSILSTVAILSFPIYDTVCGTRMLILKESIWDERTAPSQQWLCMPACGAIILFLQDTNITISFGSLIFARIFGLQLFGDVQVFNRYSVLACTAMYLANNLLSANMVADAPAQIGIYLNARHAVNLEKIPESEYKAATRAMGICRN